MTSKILLSIWNPWVFSPSATCNEDFLPQPNVQVMVFNQRLTVNRLGRAGTKVKLFYLVKCVCVCVLAGHALGTRNWNCFLPLKYDDKKHMYIHQYGLLTQDGILIIQKICACIGCML